MPVAWGSSVSALDLTALRTQVEQGQPTAAIPILVKEVDENPAHEAARVLLAEAYEKANRPDEALKSWEELLTLSSNEDHLRKARKAVSRIRRRQLDLSDLSDLQNATRASDPFKIDMPPIDWTGLHVVEDSKYLPPILPSPHNHEVPPFDYETQHFTVYSTNKRFSKVVGERAEIYLAFMLDKLFRGRSWAVRFPILVYQSESDYQSHGGPVGSGGVTYGHVTGRTQAIVLFQLKPSWAKGGPSEQGRSSSGGQEIWKYGLESVLPHELTHAVINEFFGGQEIPRWLHEAVAGRFEQTRDHYGEAARLSRKVVAGEYFRMRDMFEQPVYPERVSLFYEQSAAVVLYLFETGPDAMNAFLTELRDGKGHDAACAAALGIPEEKAVEEFERRWVDWMKVRYIKDLDNKGDNTQESTASASRHKVFQPWINELDTVESVRQWRDVELAKLDGFRGVGGSKQEWAADGTSLRCDPKSGDPSLLGLRMNEKALAVVTCEVRSIGAPSDEPPSFGFAQLDADGYDTRVQVRTPLRPGTSHKLVCLWSDDLALYVDGVCVARFPAFHVRGEERDIDYPLALLANSPVEVQAVRVGHIESFSTKPVVAQAHPNQPKPGEQPRQSRESRRENRENRRRAPVGGG